MEVASNTATFRGNEGGTAVLIDNFTEGWYGCRIWERAVSVFASGNLQTLKN